MRVLQGSGDLLRDAISMGDERPSQPAKDCKRMGLLERTSSPVACWLVS
jgi:hypothetical protein